jgi:Cu2+-containing amine oxidase
MVPGSERNWIAVNAVQQSILNKRNENKKKHMKIITKFIFGFPMLALACGSIAFAQVPIAPVTPPDSAAKAAALPPPGGNPVHETVAFKSGSRWDLTVNAVERFGLVITGASFQKSPNDRFIYVLFDGRLGEIYVPYHPGVPRYGDISGYANGIPNRIGPYDPMELEAAKFPKPLKIIGGGKICKEERAYLAWMDNYTSSQVRYGEEVVYFAVLHASNYDYIMEWTFRDDGAIQVRAGSTGPKLGGGNDKRGHMHNFTWRLDIDLNGADNNSAEWTKHEENLTVSPFSTAEDKKDLISVEGGLDWNPQNFNTLQIFDRTLKNGAPPNGRRTSYELVPMRTGTARHTEPFLKKDFWVTRYNPTQSLLAYNLPDYVRDKQPTVDKDLVIWYTGSEHHENNSRDEDKNTVPVLWTGFDLVPNNLFNHTPFYH